ncbi:hypothetical protein HZH66_014612 [Vespula vulgaris]|uniref:Uncharacterized protein n=1 Tax=Vespula vulgaris TaxID=7454 RepID=A0A834J234_VESVU|nr:hypothetical protein HZH66_014612 [Vespula vulgaris]
MLGLILGTVRGGVTMMIVVIEQADQSESSSRNDKLQDILKEIHIKNNAVVNSMISYDIKFKYDLTYQEYEVQDISSDSQRRFRAFLSTGHVGVLIQNKFVKLSSNSLNLLLNY